MNPAGTYTIKKPQLDELHATSLQHFCISDDTYKNIT
jgi:hypothetical protein